MGLAVHAAPVALGSDPDWAAGVFSKEAGAREHADGDGEGAFPADWPVAAAFWVMEPPVRIVIVRRKGMFGLGDMVGIRFRLGA